MAAYKAGQSKNMDTVVEAADTVTTACMNCHDVYREKTPKQGGLAARCDEIEGGPCQARQSRRAFILTRSTSSTDAIPARTRTQAVTAGNGR